MNVQGSHILSVSQFERDSIEHIFRVADQMEPYAQRKRITRAVSYTHLTLPTNREV